MKIILMLFLLLGTCFAQDKVVDKKFIFTTTFSVAGAAADVASTSYCFKHNPNCYEGMGMMFSGKRPNTLQLSLSRVPMQVGINGLGYLLKKKKKKFWWIPQVAYGFAQIGVSIHNIKNAHR